MNKDQLIARFKSFAIEVAMLLKTLPKDAVNSAYSNQLIRSSSSAGANYRAACRAKSTPDFINKLKIVEEETDESIYFIELLEHFNPQIEQFKHLITEGNILLAITVKSLITSRETLRAQIEKDRAKRNNAQ